MSQVAETVMNGVRRISYKDWLFEGMALFEGKPPREWLFVCPQCETPQSMLDLVEVGVSRDKVTDYIGFSCIGRFTKDKGCDWTLGGLFHIHKLEVRTQDGQHWRMLFEFHKPGEAP